MTKRKTDIEVLPITGFVAPVIPLALPPASFEEYVKRNEFDITKPPDDADGVLFLRDCLIGSKGNFITITGLAKSRKSVVAGAASSAFLLRDEFLGFRWNLPDDAFGMAIDSEQGYYHYYKTTLRTLTNASLQDMPKDRFKSIRARDGDELFRTGLVEYLVERHQPAFMVLDVITDWIEDINNQEQAKKVGDWVLSLTEKFNRCLFILVIHLTKGNNNMTGAIGTILEKKCQTAISVELTPDNEELMSTVRCKMARDRAFPTYNIEYNEETHSYNLVDEKRVTSKGKGGNKEPSAYAEDVVHKILHRVFLMVESVEKRMIIDRIKRAVKDVTNDVLNTVTAKQWCDWFLAKSMIIDGGEKDYMIVRQVKPADATPPVLQKDFDFNHPEDDLGF